MLLRDRHAAKLLDTDHGDWRNQAACKNHDPELWFPHPGSDARAAKAICATCPVIGPCRAWADETGDDWAVLGGTTARQRRAEATRRRQQPGPLLRRCRWCRGMFMTNGAQYCSQPCRNAAGHNLRAGQRRTREETPA